MDTAAPCEDPSSLPSQAKSHAQDANDWAISRTRFWGTPLPLWASEDGKEVVVISSKAQLEELSGEKVRAFVCASSQVWLCDAVLVISSLFVMSCTTDITVSLRLCVLVKGSTRSVRQPKGNGLAARPLSA